MACGPLVAPHPARLRQPEHNLRATCRTVVTNPQGAATQEGAVHFFFVGARYDDDFVRTAAGWKIAKRVETTLWFQGSLPDGLLIQR